MSTWPAEQILRAGGTVRTATDDSMPLQARAWRHPATGDLTMIRLVRSELAGSEDLALATIGFTPAGHTPVGHTARRALGFPEWALINDPANATHALEVVPDLDRVRRLARTRAQEAKNLAEAVHARLERAQPAYLPTFCEEVGRAFLAADNRNWAGQWFNRAREAEATYRLAVDEDRHRQVFLEFAYAQCLPVKAISAEAKLIGGRLPADRAFATFRRFVIERVRGGLAPYTAMTTDLEQLAKAAGVDPQQVTREVLDEVLDQPSVAAAPTGWWKSVRGPLADIVAENPDVAVRLSTLRPDRAVTGWVDVLADVGVLHRLDEFTREQLLAMTDSLVYLAGIWAWETNNRPDRLIDLLEQVLRRVGEAEGHQLPRASFSRMSLDVVDLLCAHGFRVPVGGWHGLEMDLPAWHRHENRRDLSAIAADPELSKLLADSIVAHQWQDFVEPGLRQVVDSRVARIVAALGDRPTLAEVAAVLSRFDFLVAEYPVLAEALAAVDLAGAVLDTMHAGVRAELQWPAFDEAVHQDIDQPVADLWPDLLLSDNRGRTVLLDRAGVTPVIDPAPANVWLTDWATAETELARVWQVDHDTPCRGVWLSDPTNVRDWAELFWPGDITFASLGNGHGGRITGVNRVRYPDDLSAPYFTSMVWSDGERFWSGHAGEVQEIDPRTGAPGRPSLPGFLADAAADLGELDLTVSQYRPVPEGLPAHDGWSNGGTVNGQLGIAIAQQPDGGALIRTLATPRIEVAPPRLPIDLGPVQGLLRFPGAEQDVVVRASGITTLDGRVLLVLQDFEAGAPDELTPGVPWLQLYDNVPWQWAVQLAPADPPLSATLRAFTAEQAARLIDADGPDSNEDGTPAEVAALISLLEADDVDATLSIVVMGVGRLANRLARRISTLGSTPEGVDAADLPGLEEAVHLLGYDNGAGAGLRTPVGRRLGEGEREQINTADLDRAFAALAARLAGDEVVFDIQPEAGVWWALTQPAAWLYAAALSDTGEAERHALLTVVGLALRHGLIDDDIHVLECERADPDVAPHKVGDRFDLPAPTVIVHSADTLFDHLYGVVQRGERLGAPPNAAVIQEFGVLGTRDPDMLQGLLDRITAGARIEWDAELVGRFAELAGLPLAQAAMIWGGLAARHRVPLPKHAVEALGLSAAEAKQVVGAMNAGDDAYRAVIAAGIAGWDGRPDLAAMAEQWRAHSAGRVTLPEDIAGEFGAAFPHTAGELLTWLVDPSAEVDHEFVVGALLWLQYRLPWGQLRREVIPRGFAKLSEAVHTERFTFAHYTDGPELTDALQLLGLGRDDTSGPVWVEQDRDYQHWVNLVVDPTRVTDHEEQQLARLKELTDAHIPRYDRWANRAVYAPLAAQAVVEFGHEVAEGAELRDPRVSVPELVEEVAGELGVSHDAATYFLIVLALPDPTTKNVRAWTGWTAKRVAAAAGDLVGGGWLVAAKRARAGRNWFLPGPWVNSQSPALPLEEWKAPMFGMSGKWPDGLRGHRVLPWEPVPVLFARAWQRLQDGDRPGHVGFEDR